MCSNNYRLQAQPEKNVAGRFWTISLKKNVDQNYFSSTFSPQIDTVLMTLYTHRYYTTKSTSVEMIWKKEPKISTLFPIFWTYWKIDPLKSIFWNLWCAIFTQFSLMNLIEIKLTDLYTNFAHTIITLISKDTIVLTIVCKWKACDYMVKLSFIYAHFEPHNRLIQFSFTKKSNFVQKNTQFFLSVLVFQNSEFFLSEKKSLRKFTEQQSTIATNFILGKK